MMMCPLLLVTTTSVALARATDDLLRCPAGGRRYARATSTRLQLDEVKSKAAHDRASNVQQATRVRKRQYNPGYAASQFHQDATLVQVFDAIGTMSRYFVEWGARRPNVLNSAHFRKHCGWCGLLLDGAPGASRNGGSHQFPDIKEMLAAPNASCTRLRQAFITPDNVNEVLAAHSVPAEVDLLTVDMDGQDFWVLSAFDFVRIRPRVVAVEFSSHFAAHEMCTTRRDAGYAWDYRTGREIGSSLALLDRLLACRGYQYITQIAGEHGIWVLRSELAGGESTALAKAAIPERVMEGRGAQIVPRKVMQQHLADIVCNVEPPPECMRQRIPSEPQRASVTAHV